MKKWFKPKEDHNVEFKNMSGGVSLQRKQYPYMIDDPQHEIISDQEMIDKIETLAKMPITEIVVLLDADGIAFHIDGMTLNEIHSKLSDGFSAIPF